MSPPKMLSTLGIPMDCVFFVKKIFCVSLTVVTYFMYIPLTLLLSVERSYAALQLKEFFGKKICVQY